MRGSHLCVPLCPKNRYKAVPSRLRRSSALHFPRCIANNPVPITHIVVVGSYLWLKALSESPVESRWESFISTAEKERRQTRSNKAVPDNNDWVSCSGDIVVI